MSEHGLPFQAGWRPEQVADAETAVLPGEVVVFHPSTHALHRIDATAAAVWLWCDGTAKPSEIAAELAPAFGGAADRAAEAVDQALEQLAAHGLLRGCPTPELIHLVTTEDHLAADGSRVLTPSSGYLQDDDIDERVTDGPSGEHTDPEFPARLVVRLGGGRNRLVVIDTDSSDSLGRLRAVLADWLDDTVAEELADAAPAFQVRLTPVALGRGRTELPFLRHGSALVSQARTASPVAHALCSLLAGIHHLDDNPFPSVGLRAFVRDDLAVLADVPSPALVADRTLRDLGITELACWQLTLRPDGQVAVAPPLAPLHWLAGGFDPPAPGRAAWTPVGMLTIDEQPMVPGALLVQLARHCSSPVWFRFVAAAVTSGGAGVVGERAAFRARLHAMLTKS